MKTTRTIGAALKLLIFLLAISTAASAATYTKANNTTALNLTGAWVTGIVPTPTDIALWDSTVLGANSSSLGANTSWQGIQITNPGGNVGITGTQSLTLGSSGIDASTYTGTLQLLNTTVILGGAQTWNFGSSGSLNIFASTLDNGGNTLTINSTNSAKNLYIAGNMTGSGGLTMTGGVTFGISGNSTYTGTTTIENGSSLDIGRSGVGGSISSSSNITSSTTGTLLFTRTTDFTFANTISGGINLSKQGASTMIVAGGNSYTGKTWIYGGALSVSSLNSVGIGHVASSSLGAPTTSTNGVISFGLGAGAGQLIYTGTGETSDRIIKLNGSTGGATIDQSGTGLLKFTSANFANAGAKTLTLQGSTVGTGEISGAIVNDGGTISVTKVGTSTWTLSGVNTYTGTTTISSGTLLINTQATAGNSGTGGGSVNVTAGTLGGTGILRPSGTNTLTVSSGAFLAPGDSTTGNGIGTLALDGGGTTGALLTMSSGAKMSFQLGSALASDKLNLWNYAGATDFVLNSNELDITFLAGSAPGTYNLFNFYSGNGTGLIASGISSGLSVNFLNGGNGTLDYATTGQINLVVTTVPEPAAWALLAFSLTTIMVMHRRNKLPLS